MNRCASCGLELSATMTLCMHHDQREAGWADTNRIMCDLLHRHITPPRLRRADPDEIVRAWVPEMVA